MQSRDGGSDPDSGSNRTFNKCQIPCWLPQCACAACFAVSCFGVRRHLPQFHEKMAPRSTVYDFFEEIDGFFKCEKWGSQLKKPADRSTGTLRKHANTHGDIETKREVERTDCEPLRVWPTIQIGFFGSDPSLRIGSKSPPSLLQSRPSCIFRFFEDPKQKHFS
ncbi:hypothetical protein L596_029853 [Steinernema carpocapsae]|uniref:Uncharacterized protein n=1 Tax=Steinernema carpocapsae TaxID=34508 RepID=A0A4V5ZX66_STECR|nr:hypothetical protein L596_029853 [Steinernema carpocapsae]